MSRYKDTFLCGSSPLGVKGNGIGKRSVKKMKHEAVKRLSLSEQAEAKALA